MFGWQIGCFNCDESDHKMRDCPVLTARGREGKQVPPNGFGMCFMLY